MHMNISTSAFSSLTRLQQNGPGSLTLTQNTAENGSANLLLSTAYNINTRPCQVDTRVMYRRTRACSVWRSIRTVACRSTIRTWSCCTRASAGTRRRHISSPSPTTPTATCCRVSRPPSAAAHTHRINAARNAIASVLSLIHIWRCRRRG